MTDEIYSLQLRLQLADSTTVSTPFVLIFALAVFVYGVIEQTRFINVKI